MRRIPLQQFFTHPAHAGSLIKKGRGKWPDDALATSLRYPGEAGANSIPGNTGTDKSDAISLMTTVLQRCSDNSSSSDLPVELFLLYRTYSKKISR